MTSLDIFLQKSRVMRAVDVVCVPPHGVDLDALRDVGVARGRRQHLDRRRVVGQQCRIGDLAGVAACCRYCHDDDTGRAAHATPGSQDWFLHRFSICPWRLSPLCARHSVDKLLVVLRRSVPAGYQCGVYTAVSIRRNREC